MAQFDVLKATATSEKSMARMSAVPVNQIGKELLLHIETLIREVAHDARSIHTDAAKQKLQAFIEANFIVRKII